VNRPWLEGSLDAAKEIIFVKEEELAAGAYTRSHFSSTWAFFGIGGARRDCVARVKGVLGGVYGV
jgi:hypothetical protein